jgi:O-antigen ligase
VLEWTSKKLSQFIVLGLIATALFATLAHGAVEPWSVLIFASSLIVLLLAWAVQMAAAGQVKVRIPATALAMVAFILLGLLQAVARTDEDGRRWSAALDVEATRYALIIIFCLFGGFMLAANFLVSKEQLRGFARFAIVYGMALAIFALIQHFTWNGRFYWFRELSTPATTVVGPFVNHNHFAGYIEMLLPIPAALLMTRGVSREVRLIYFFAVILMSIVIIASLSRGGMISFAVSLSFVLVMSIRAAKRRRRTSLGDAPARFALPAALPQFAAVVVLVLTIGAGIFWVGADPVLNRLTVGAAEKNETVGTAFFQNRGFIWRDTVAMIRANPLLGVGLGSFPTAYPIFTQSNGSLLVTQAHNDYLQVLADGGIIGGLIALGFLLLLLRDIERSINHPDPMLAALALGFSGGIVALLVHSLFDFNLQLPSNALLFLMLCAFISNISERAAPAKAKMKLKTIVSG